VKNLQKISIVKDPSGKEFPLNSVSHQHQVFFTPKQPGTHIAELYSGPEKIAQIPVVAAQPAIVEQPVSLEVLDFGTCRSQKKLKLKSVIPLETKFEKLGGFLLKLESAQPATIGKPISRCLKVESILKISNQLSVIPLEN